MAATDLRRQFLAENSQLLSFWRANVGGEVSSDGGPAPLWSKENQLEVWSSRRETARIVSRQKARRGRLKTVPAQVGASRSSRSGTSLGTGRGLTSHLDMHVRVFWQNTALSCGSASNFLHRLCAVSFSALFYGSFAPQRSFGVRPVCLAMRASILGPISSDS